MLYAQLTNIFTTIASMLVSTLCGQHCTEDIEQFTLEISNIPFNVLEATRENDGVSKKKYCKN